MMEYISTKRMSLYQITKIKIAEYLEHKRKYSTLKNAISEHPNANPVLHKEQPACASSESFYRWDRLNFDVIKWSFSNQGLRTNKFEFSELRSTIEETTTVNANIELQEVTAFTFSKSDLENAVSLDDFAMKYCPKYIDEISEIRLNQMLSHSGIKVIHRERTGDHFKQLSWRPGIVLVNSDGSHHFTAARYIASKLNKKIEIKGRLVSCRISQPALVALRQKYTIFLIEKNIFLFDTISTYLRKTSTNFIFLETQPNAHIPGDLLILENQNAIIIQEFKDNGFVDVGEFLSHFTD